MIKKILGILAICSVGLFFVVVTAYSQSIYGISFLGEHHFNGSIRYRSLGLSSFAVPDSNNAAAANVATLADLDGFTLSLVQILSISSINTEDESADRNRYQIPELVLAVPLKKGLVASAGYRMRFQGHGDFEYERPLPDLPTALEIHTQRGSLFSVPFSLAWKATDWLNVAGEIQIERGSISNEVSIDFKTLGWETADSKRELFYSGISWSAAVLLKVHPRIFVAAAFDDKIDYDVDEKFTYSRSDLDSTAVWNFNLPYAYSVAFALGLTNRWWLSSHFWFREAPEPAGHPQLAGALRDERLLAFGLERRRRERGGFFSRIPIRLGFYENVWHLEYPGGQPVKARFFTFGSGFSMPGGPGILDLSFEFGKIGSIDDNGLDERMIRIGLGLSFSETWSRRKDEKH